MNRYFIYLGYDGTNYHGWQIQPNGRSVQQTLMEALETFLRKKVEVTGAGRTDAGVHARLMVAHFDWEEPLDTEAVAENTVFKRLGKGGSHSEDGECKNVVQQYAKNKGEKSCGGRCVPAHDYL